MPGQPQPTEWWQSLTSPLSPRCPHGHSGGLTWESVMTILLCDFQAMRAASSGICHKEKGSQEEENLNNRRRQGQIMNHSGKNRQRGSQRRAVLSGTFRGWLSAASPQQYVRSLPSLKPQDKT